MPKVSAENADRHPRNVHVSKFAQRTNKPAVLQNSADPATKRMPNDLDLIFFTPNAFAVCPPTIYHVDDRSTIMKNTVHKRESLIHEGLRALLARGYDGVGIEEILRAQNVPKGSFYHFFKSKEEFSCCVLAAYSAHYATIRAKIFLDMMDSPSIRLRRYFKLLERELSQSIVEGGCLLGVFAQTAGNRGPALRKQLIESFREWEESLTLVVVEAQQRGDIASDRDAQLIAALLIDAYEGAIVRVKASGKMLAYRRFMKQVLEPLLWSGTTHKNGLATPHGD